MKLNRKGYMLVEIIIASVLAMSIAYYLLNLTYKFKDTNSDLYQSYFFVKDKLLITKNIMSDIERGTILEIVHPNRDNYQTIEFNLQLSSGIEKRRLEVTKVGSNTVIKYGKIDTDATNPNIKKYVTSDISYYEKVLEKSLIVEEVKFSKENDAAYIEIPIKSIYDNKDYTVKIIGHKKYRVDTNIKSATTDSATSWVSHWYGYNKDHALNPGDVNYPNVGNPVKKDILITLEANGREIKSGSDPFVYLAYNTTLVISKILYKDETGNFVPLLNYNDSNKISIKILNDTNLYIHINDADRENIKYIEKRENEGLVSKLEVGKI